MAAGEWSRASDDSRASDGSRPEDLWLAQKQPQPQQQEIYGIGDLCESLIGTGVAAVVAMRMRDERGATTSQSGSNSKK